MKIRIYSPSFPYPITEGSFQVIFDQALSLSRMGHEIELVVWKDSLETIASKIHEAEGTLVQNLPWKVRSLLDLEEGSKTLEVVAREFMWQKIKPRKENGFKRALRIGASLTSSSASPELFYYPAVELPFESFEKFDLGIYHYSFAYSWLSRARSPEARIAVHFHNLESELFKLRSKTSRLRPARLLHMTNAFKLARHELALARRADELWFVSPVDLDDFRARAPETDTVLRFVPPTYDGRILAGRLKSSAAWDEGSESEKMVAGFIGGLDFQPNFDSVVWILKEVAPILHNAGFKGKLKIVGKNPPAHIHMLANYYPFVDILGFVPDLEDFWASLSFMLVPHVSGSGVRMKLLEAVASGVPVIANDPAIKRCHSLVQQSPLVYSSSSPRAWVARLLDEKAKEARNKEATLPFNKGLEGESIYGFLSQAVK